MLVWGGSDGEDLADGGLYALSGNASPPASFVQNLDVTQSAGEVHVMWDPVPGATAYDLIKGSLVNLRSSHGDFAFATNTCVADDTPGVEALHNVAPAPGFGFFYLVRPLNCAGNGSYNEGSPAQIGLRDSEIDSSGFCQ